MLTFFLIRHYQLLKNKTRRITITWWVIEAETNWLLFCRRRFWIHSLECNVLYYNQTFTDPRFYKRAIADKSTSGQVIAWHISVKDVSENVVYKMVAILSWPQSVNGRVASPHTQMRNISGLILGLRPANERRRYFVTTPIIGCVKA